MTAAASPKGAPGAKPGAKPAPFKLPSALSRMKVLVSVGKADGLAKDARSVLLHIGVYVDTDGIAYPSPSLIATDTGYSERAVRNALGALRAAGIVLSLPPAAARFAFPERGARAPKHLPLLLLWPIAPREARMKAVAARRTKPATPNLSLPTLGRCFVTTTPGSNPQGPYTALDLERFARDCPGAEDWMVCEEPVEAGKPGAAAPLSDWYAFAAALPRVPTHHRIG